MKQTLAIILFFTCAFYSFAEDIICFKNGDIVKAEIFEITSSEVKYKKSTNPSGSTYVINKTEILSIQYSNGEIERFNSVENVAAPSASNQVFMSNKFLVPCSSDNDSLIYEYNHLLTAKEHPSNKKSHYYTLKWGITSESILSNEEISIGFYRDYQYPYGVDGNAPYVLYIKNKTDSPIIVDLARCYRTDRGSTRCFFDSSISTSVSSSSNSFEVSASLPLSNIFPGVGFASHSSGGSITSYNPNQIITVPPQGKIELTHNKLVKIGRNKYRFISVGEGFNACPLHKDEILKNTIYNYSESNSPQKYNYYITYTSVDRPYEYTEIKFTTFVQQIICGLRPIPWGGSNRKIGDEISEYGIDCQFYDDIPKNNQKIEKFVDGYSNGIHLLGGNLYD